MAASSPPPVPSSILIVGSGVFGLSTALSLSRNKAFKDTSITLLDRAPDLDVFPSPDAASIEASRIIRPDYADPLYSRLAAEAHQYWRKPAHDFPSSSSALGNAAVYHETGLVLVARDQNIKYVKASFENAKCISPEAVKELPDADSIKARIGTGGATGTWGYVNESSGWANAGAAMSWLLARVRETDRVKMVCGKAVSLETTASGDNSSSLGQDTVTGVALQDGRVLRAELVILAAGAWTGMLLDLSGQLWASGQAIGYLPVSDEEQQSLSNIPVSLDLSTGYFIFPPADNMLKIARHHTGYLNPISIPSPLPSQGPCSASLSSSTAIVSVPITNMDDPTACIPPEAEQGLHDALCAMVPLRNVKSRTFIKTRMCWYADTPTANFIVDYHPRWKGLFVATGGSGHAFKFLPVLGDKVVECMLGTAPADIQRQWSWTRSLEHIRSAPTAATEDGSRSGDHHTLILTITPPHETAKYRA